MALFELLEHVVRDCLIRGHAVFNRQAVNHTEFDPAGLHIVREHVFEHAGGFLCNDRADTVAATNANDDFIKLVIVDKILIRLDAVRTLILLAHERLKVCYR